MSNNPRPTKRSRLPRHSDSSDSPEAGPSTGVDTYQGIGPAPGTLDSNDSSPYHINSAVIDNTSDRENSGTYNAQSEAANNPALDSKATCLEQSSTGHAYSLVSGPLNPHEYEHQQYHRSPLERITSSMREQQHAWPTEYPQLFLDSRSQHNLDVHVATSPSLPTTNSSFGSPGPSSQAFASGRVKDTSGRQSHKRKTTDEDPDEGALIPPHAPFGPYHHPVLGRVYVPAASLGQQQAPPSAYLPPYGISPGAPGLVPDVSGSSGSVPSFTTYPSQPVYGLPASDIQAPTHFAPSPPDVPTLGGLRRSPRLARHAEGDEISENDSSPPQSAASGSAPPTARSERDKSNRKKNAQKQRNNKVDRFWVLNSLLEEFRVVRDIADDGKRKNLKWTPQQQILTNAIAYVQHVQKARSGVMIERDQALVECQAARAELEQLRVDQVQERGRLEQEKATYREENKELLATVRNCRLGLTAKESNCIELETRVQTLQGKVTELQRQVDEFSPK